MISMPRLSATPSLFLRKHLISHVYSSPERSTRKQGGIFCMGTQTRRHFTIYLFNPCFRVPLSGDGYPVVRRVLRTRDLVKKTTGSGKYFSLIGNRLMVFGEDASLTGNRFPGIFKPRHIPPIFLRLLLVYNSLTTSHLYCKNASLNEPTGASHPLCEG